MAALLATTLVCVIASWWVRWAIVPSVVCGIVLAVCAGWVAFGTEREHPGGFRAAQFRKQFRCAKCGYARHGLETSVCPECGYDPSRGGANC